MTKEETIKEAYGEYFNKDINENGWCSNHSVRIRMDSMEIERSRFGWRPKSLSGIEKNNGWIKIESESDLPKETDNYFVVNELGILMRGFCIGEINHWKDITHYQPVINPKPPIY